MKLDYTKLGTRINMRRRELKMKQSGLAKEIGMTNNHISNIENGYTVPSLETLLKICHALDVTPDYLLMGSIKDSPSQNIIDNLSLCSKDDLETIEEIIRIFVAKNKTRTLSDTQNNIG